MREFTSDPTRPAVVCTIMKNGATGWKLVEVKDGYRYWRFYHDGRPIETARVKIAKSKQKVKNRCH